MLWLIRCKFMMRKVNHDHEVTGSDVVLIWPQGQDRIIHNRQTHTCTKDHYATPLRIFACPISHSMIPFCVINNDQPKPMRPKQGWAKWGPETPNPINLWKTTHNPNAHFTSLSGSIPRKDFWTTCPPPLKIVYINVLLYDDFHWEARLGGLCHHGRRPQYWV